MVRTLSLLAVTALHGVAHASGFAIAEQGARAAGVANAVVARGADSSAVAYNPAGIAALDGVHVLVGGNLLLPTTRLTERGTGQVTEAKQRSFATPTLFFALRTSDLLAFGVGVYSPYGLGLTWPNGWSGSDIVRRAELSTLFISPVVAVSFEPWVPGLSMAAGVDVVPASVELSRDVRFASASGRVHLGGRALGVGGRLGLSYDLEPLSLGLVWRSPVQLAFAGDADIDADPIFRAELPPDGRVGTDVTLPHALSLGVAWAITGGLVLEVDASWIGWSSYDALTIEFADGTTTTELREWRDTVAIRAGVEWKVGPVTLRGGYAYEATPVPKRRLDPTLPDGNRHVVATGLGVDLPAGVRADLGVTWVLPLERETGARPVLRGTYDISAVVASASVAMAFNQPPERVDTGEAS